MFLWLLGSTGNGGNTGSCVWHLGQVGPHWQEWCGLHVVAGSCRRDWHRHFASEMSSTTADALEDEHSFRQQWWQPVSLLGHQARRHTRRSTGGQTKLQVTPVAVGILTWLMGWVAHSWGCWELTQCGVRIHSSSLALSLVYPDKQRSYVSIHWHTWLPLSNTVPVPVVLSKDLSTEHIC